MTIAYWTVSKNSKKIILTAPVRLDSQFLLTNKFSIQINCPHGCPCENYDCDANDDPDLIVNGPIQIKKNQVIGEISTYNLNHSFEFEFKSNRKPRGGGQCSQILQGCITSG